MNKERIQTALSDGLLSFPVTDMNAKGVLDEQSYAGRIRWFLRYPVSAIFAAGGTGEFFSLSRDEYQAVVSIAAGEVNGRIPVLASAGRSIPEAIQFARIAEEAGIDGLLLMPPYLVNGPRDGVYEYAKAILGETDLPVIFYNRSNGILTAKELEKLAAECPNLIGLKDGTGNLQDLNDIIKTLGDRLVYIGGVPTAEIISEAYLSIGVNTYSSAVFNFVPELALHFYRCLRDGDREQVQRVLREFYIPFVRLRGRKAGYAVSLIKAGARLIGKEAGNVRAPLVMPTEAETKMLGALIEKAKALVA